MFDGTDACTDGVFNTNRAMGMCGDKFALCLCGLNDRAQLRFAKFRLARFCADGQHRACSDGLNEVSALFDEERRPGCGLFGRARNPKPHVGRQLVIGYYTVQFAAAFGQGDIGTGNEHARPRHMTRVDCITQGDIG